MYCLNCGKKISDNSKFCRYCGANQLDGKVDVDKKSNANKERGLICPACGASMDIIERDNSIILNCAFCGYCEMIPESDAVKIQKIKSNAFRDVENEKIRLQRDEFEQKVTNEKEIKEEIKLKPIKRVVRIWEIIYVVFFLLMLLSDNRLPKIVGTLGILALVAYHMFRRKFIMSKKPWFGVLAIGLSVVCFLFLFKADDFEDKLEESRQLKEEASKTFEWPSSGLAKLLPEPPSLNGSLDLLGDDIFEADVYAVTDEEYKAYVKKCKSMGFTKNTIEYEGELMAHNDENYYLNLEYESDIEKMKIFLSATQVKK